MDITFRAPSYPGDIHGVHQLRIFFWGSHEMTINKHSMFYKMVPTRYNLALQTSFPNVAEGSLEVKLPTIWTDERHSQEETRTWTPLWREADLKVKSDKTRRSQTTFGS